VLDTGGYVALALVAVEVMLIIFFVRGKTSKGTFVAASVPMVFLAGFFWMGGRVTEMTIAGIGTIKTAVNLATQYIEDIKHIKADVEQQKEAIDAVAKAARTTDHVINELAQKIDQGAAQLPQLTEHVTRAKKLTEELQLKQEYFEVSKLNALGLTGLLGKLVLS